jgi:glucan-binding YG repeat protein
MRKQTKLVAVLSTAALLAIGASMTSFAAQGWAEEDGTWVYYNKDGDKATDTWKKSGDNWYWLDDGGEMATDMLIEDDDNYYYVDANGAMVRNQWVAVENEDAGEDDEPDHYWYYFQSNGKAYKRSDNASDKSISAKTINGKKYAFDTEGRMLYGWVSEGERQTDDDAWKNAEYYFGDEDDGAMSSGWRLINLTDDEYESLQPGDEYWDEEQDRWFYFQASGKKVAADDGKILKTKTINGKKYGFDEDGRMVSSWNAKLSAASLSTVEASQNNAKYAHEFMYFSTPEDGARYTKGWFKVVPGYYLEEDEYNDGSDSWYYADGDGQIYASVIENIKGKKYAFNENGRMIDGLVFLEMNDSKNISEVIDDDNYDTEENFDEYVTDEAIAASIAKGDIRCYYFGDGDDGAMKTGKQTVSIDGESFTFKFKTSSSTKGSGIVGEDDHKLYNAGKLVKADSDDKYQVVAFDTVNKTSKKMDVEDFLKLGIVHEVTETEKGYDKDATTWTVTQGDKDETVYYLVNTSGSMLKKKSNAKDGDDYKFTTDNYKITKIVLED